MASVKQYDNINLKKINILKPEKINNSYFGFMNYDENKEPIYIQTPKLKSNINAVDILDSKNPHLDVTISLNDINFYDLLVKIDDTIVTMTHKNSENWFSKELPLNVIDAMPWMPEKTNDANVPANKPIQTEPDVAATAAARKADTSIFPSKPISKIPALSLNSPARAAKINGVASLTLESRI